MKIVHLSTSDISGGASRAAYRLHRGLLQQGIDSKMFVRDKSSENKSVVRYKYPAGLEKAKYKYRKYLINKDYSKYKFTRPEGLELFSDDRSAQGIGLIDQLPDADVYHLHWTSGFVDLPSTLKKIEKPLVWTLHDMFPFTGGCHYNSGCDNYLRFCNNCPQLGSVTEKDLSYKIWSRKQQAISEFKNKIIIRADSRWLAGEAKKSGLFRNLDIDTIHYGIETDEFISRDKISCRKALKIPEGSRVIVFGAPGLNNPRKGFKQLIEALEEVRETRSDLFLLSFGSGSNPGTPGIPGLHLGHVSDNNLLSLIYNCADVFIIPSLQEAFGQTALEAMSCSVPVIGFNTGGIPDMIEEGITGFLVETGSITGLKDAIIRMLKLNDKDYTKMAANCRDKVLNGFTLYHQAEKYMKVYQSLL